MEQLEQTLRDLQAAPVEHMTVSLIRTDPALQPRNPKASRLDEAHRDEEAAQKQVKRFTERLTADPAFELDPVLLAKIKDRLFMLDGHHRLKAYQQARRPLITARVMETTFRQAALLATLVNLDGHKRALTTGQAMENAWQWLAEVTAQGTAPLPEGGTIRTVGARFGVGKSSIERMLKRMHYVRGLVETGYFPPEWCHPAFGWPRWKEARGDGRFKDWSGSVTPEMRDQKEIEKCAKALAKMIDRFGSGTYRKACALICTESAEDAKEDEGAC